MKIAIFDSGIGGLSVLHLALKKLPNEDFLYFADINNVPYGTKTKEQVIDYVETAINFMLQQDVKAIVVACNTATSAAIEIMRKKYSLPIIGMEPAVKKAVDSNEHKRILVIATPITVKGEKLQNLIAKVDKDYLVDLVPLPQLVNFAENEIFDTEEVENYLKNELKKFDFYNYSSIVLGCTHFNYFKDTLKKILPKHINILDGNEGTVNRLISELKKYDILENQKIQNIEFFYSGKKVEDIEELHKIKRYKERLDKMLEIK